MNFDWITNPIGIFMFGIVITAGFVFTTWRDTHSVKRCIFTFLSGILSAGIMVLILNSFGYLSGN